VRNSRLLLGLIAVAAVWAFLQLGSNSGQKPVGTESTGKVSSAVVLQINPSIPSSPEGKRAVLPDGSSWRDYEKATNLHALYERLSANPVSGEASYLRYRIVAECENVRRRGSELDSLAASLQGAEQRRRREALAHLRGRCDGMSAVPYSDALAASLLADAVERGDRKAIVHQLAQDILLTARDTFGPSISEDQLSRLRSGVQSKDPVAMVMAGQTLSNAFRDLVIEETNSGREIDYRTAREAWRMLGCDFGLECGVEHQAVMEACAFEGHCDAITLPDFLYFYRLSPAEAQAAARYRMLFLTAAESGDWSGLRFSRRQNPNGGRALFAPP